MADKPKDKPSPNEAKPSDNNPPTIGYEIIPVDMIDDPERPMRSDLNPANVEELILSIKQVGLLEPLIVKPTKGRFEVIAGHRRLYACQLGKIAQVPCLVRKATAEQTEMLKIHENLFREDISPADEARHFDYLIQKQGLTPTRIAQLISKSNSYVGDRLAILNYHPILKQAMDQGTITFSVAREFAKFDDEKQLKSAIYYAKRSGMSSDMARRWVIEWKSEKDSPYRQNATPPDRPEGEKPVEHDTQCIFCGGGMKLYEAEVVYMHSHCLGEAQQILKQPDDKVEAQS